MKGLNYMNFSHDTTITEYEISLSSCRDIIEEIFDIKYKEYHNIGIKSYNKYYIECRDMYVYTSCFIMGVPETILSEIENINTYEIDKIINSINKRKSIEDRKLFGKIFKFISEKKILTIIKDKT
jgi:hypothetical protein